MEQDLSFETQLNKYRVVVERYINFRLPSKFDADDVIQETYYAAYAGYENLRDKGQFKSWILLLFFCQIQRSSSTHDLNAVLRIVKMGNSSCKL